MRTKLKFATFLLTILTFGAAPLALPASAGEDPNIVVSKASNRGTSSPNCQYLLEAYVPGNQVDWIRLVVIEDRPEYADYTVGRIREDGTELKVIPLLREPHREGGVREIVGVMLPEAALRGAKNGLNIEMDSTLEILRVRLTKGYINGFLKQVDAKIKKG